MARTKGSFTLGGTLEIEADAPADARLQVKTKADLTASGSFPYKYIGMIVSVESEEKAYMLVGSDPTVLANWKEQGGGGSASAMSDLTDVDLDNLDDGQILKYNSTTEKWENAEETGGESIQVDELPTASASLEGKIYQYVGETDANYTNGYFYECVSDGEATPTYSWAEKSVQENDGTISVELTQAQYDALSQAEKMNGTVYYITDGSGGGGGGASSLSELSDVSIDSVEDGNVLVYNDLTSKWENSEPFEIGLTANVTSNLTVGAIPSGTTLTKGTQLTEIVQKLLVSEVAPTINFSLSKSGAVTYGESYTETLAVAVTNMGSAKKIKTIAWYEGNTLKQTDTIDSTVTGSWTYTMGTATTDTTTFKAVITYTKSDDVDTSVTKTANINFYYTAYYGVVDTLTPDEATVKALSTRIGSSRSNTYQYTANAQRICNVYPKSLGSAVTIKDGNGFSLMDSFTKTEVTYTQNGTSVAYFRYVLTDPTTVTNYTVAFT